jgi:hypothetical protein
VEVASLVTERAANVAGLLWMVVAATIVLLLNSLGLNGLGLVTAFHLFLIPSAIFGGYVLGRTLKLPLWGRLVSTLVTSAALAAYLPYA